MIAEGQSLASRVAQVCSLAPDAGAVEYEGRWATWDAFATAGARVETLLAAAGVPRSAPVGWLARNSSASVASFAALLLAGRPIAPLMPGQPLAALGDEVRAQNLAAVLAEAADWSSAAFRDAVAGGGGVGLALGGWEEFEADLCRGLDRLGPGSFRTAEDIVVERVSSGTMGTPKRIPVGSEALMLALRAAETAASSSRRARGLVLKTSPAVIVAPLSHASGVFALLFALYQARPMVVLERFTVEGWVDAVRRHRPKSASLAPTMIRMLLDASVPEDTFSSLMAVHCGTAALGPEEQEAFERRFKTPVLAEYGAAEFIGGVAGWSLADHRRFGPTKRGSAGRPRADVQLRTVEPASGRVLGAGETGLLEVNALRFGLGWRRTHDLACLDDDGFLYVVGRADDAINRGGFKILPDEVAALLRQHPFVADAAVIGMPDARLGQVPVALIEVRGIQPAPAELERYARAHLAPYQVPVEFRFVEALPRTATLKVSRPELRRILGA